MFILYMKNSKPANDSGSLISASTTCLLKSSEVREHCSANNHRKSSKNSSKSYSIHGGKGWVQTMQKTQTTGIFKGNSQDNPHNGTGSTVNWSPFSSQGGLFNQTSVFSVKLCTHIPLCHLPQLLLYLSYKKDREVNRESYRLNFPVWTPSTSLWMLNPDISIERRDFRLDLCANPNSWI